MPVTARCRSHATATSVSAPRSGRDPARRARMAVLRARRQPPAETYSQPASRGVFRPARRSSWELVRPAGRARLHPGRTRCRGRDPDLRTSLRAGRRARRAGRGEPAVRRRPWCGGRSGLSTEACAQGRARAGQARPAVLRRCSARLTLVAACGAAMAAATCGRPQRPRHGSFGPAILRLSRGGGPCPRQAGGGSSPGRAARSARHAAGAAGPRARGPGHAAARAAAGHPGGW